ncbi:hypothetical protein PINS_up014821 [Pythium insidiosum]|nr:hypothetical protein PINS_up014821 [Pythium insidiosum]
MDEDAIEAFWIRMVETRRAQRRALFAQWEKEARDAERGHLPSLQQDKKRENDGVRVKEQVNSEILQHEQQQQQEMTTVSGNDEQLQADTTATATATATKTKTKPMGQKKKKKKLSLNDLHAMPTRQLRKMLERNVVSDELRVAITSILDERWDQLERQEPAERDEL